MSSCVSESRVICLLPGDGSFGSVVLHWAQVHVPPRFMRRVALDVATTAQADVADPHARRGVAKLPYATDFVERGNGRGGPVPLVRRSNSRRFPVHRSAASQPAAQAAQQRSLRFLLRTCRSSAPLTTVGGASGSRPAAAMPRALRLWRNQAGCGLSPEAASAVPSRRIAGLRPSRTIGRHRHISRLCSDC